MAKGQERMETLVSISTDGRVLEWNLKKGLVVTTLMALKRGGAVSGTTIIFLTLLLHRSGLQYYSFKSIFPLTCDTWSRVRAG